MSPKEKDEGDRLERIFHEPSRLAILSALCAAEKGMTFGELKEACDLTDGNLNRHLAVLSEESVVRIEKAFVDARPRTTVILTKTGLSRFMEYLDALNDVLKKARNAIPAEKRAQYAPRGRSVAASGG